VYWCLSFSVGSYLIKLRSIAHRVLTTIRRTNQQQTIQAAYREVADVSLLFAMLMPHAIFFGVVALIKVFLPGKVSYLATETPFPALLKWWYPLTATILVLHHSRQFDSTTTPVDNDKKKEDKKSKGEKDGKSKDGKKKSKRRRSSIGAFITRTAPGNMDDEQHMIYTEQEAREDVNYVSLSR